MKLGYFDYNADYSIRPDILARACEERGFDSLWFGEHTHIPISRKTAYPGGGDLPKHYVHMRDPFISLMAAAAVTTRLKLGTGICVLPERDPIITAKEVATLDQLSNGRVQFGIGSGWIVEELENHGVPFKRRWDVLREHVLAIKQIWTQEIASFKGEFVNFDEMWCYPKPVQKPHPPIIMGATTTKGLQRVVDYCDGWCPVCINVLDFKSALAELRRLCDLAGRDPDSITISIWAWGDPDESVILGFQELGVDSVVIGPNRIDADVPEKVLPFLDRYAPLIGKLA